jgi:photosystem II stability/assembly factor-like uncharacterized protein
MAKTIPGDLFVSRNGGDDWTPIASTGRDLYSIACSADGKTWVCGSDSGLLISKDAGLNWVDTHQVLVGPVVCSANGNRLAGCDRGIVLTSTNDGATWQFSGGQKEFYQGYYQIAGSADLTYLISSIMMLSAGFDEHCGVVITSHDFGASWQQTSSPCLEGGVFAALSSSAQGKDLAALTDNSSIPVLRSTDGGATWSSNVVSGSETWLWGSYLSPLASSADGKRLVVGGPFGGIYTWHTTPTPELKPKMENGQFELSWLVPSSKFILQQNPDMGTSGWTDVATLPSFDATTLDYRFRPNGGGTMFYRLALSEPQQ